MCDRHLLEIIDTIDALRLGFCLGQCGQQEGCQDGDDGDNHKQLNQSKGVTPSASPNSLIVLV